MSIIMLLTLIDKAVFESGYDVVMIVFLNIHLFCFILIYICMCVCVLMCHRGHLLAEPKVLSCPCFRNTQTPLLRF